MTEALFNDLAFQHPMESRVQILGSIFEWSSLSNNPFVYEQFEGMILCTIRIIRTASNTLSLIQDGLLVHWQKLAHMSQLQHYGRELKMRHCLPYLHTYGMEIFQIAVIDSEEGTKWLVSCTIVEPLSLSLHKSVNQENNSWNPVCCFSKKFHSSLADVTG